MIQNLNLYIQNIKAKYIKNAVTLQSVILHQIY